MRPWGLCALALLVAGCSAAPVIEGPVEHLDLLAREPMLAELPDRSLFVAGYGADTPSLWKSVDGGASWARVDVGSGKDGAVGNSDVDLAVAPDGTLYFAAMTFDRKALEGRSIHVGVSADAGATWSWRRVSQTRFDDRPWIEVTPNGTAHLIWNDGAGVRHATSRDRGAHWTEGPRIHDHGGSSHLAVGPAGQLAVRITPMSASGSKLEDGVDLVAVSADDGVTWRKYPAPGERRWTADENAPLNAGRWVEPLAWDSAGALYSLWTTPEALWLGRSADGGETFSVTRLAQGGDPRFFPYLAARGAGELAATWWTYDGKALAAHAGMIRAGADGAARLREAAPFRPDTWGHARDASKPLEPDTAGEYLAARFLSDGSLAIVSPIQRSRDRRYGFALWRMDPR